MKKKNKKTNKKHDAASAHLQNQIKRRQEKLKKQEEKREKSLNALFRRRVREASEKKAPKTLRTKAYYRFSRDFPAAVTPDGFRENNPEKEKLSFGKKLAVFLCCAAVFILSFTAVKTAVQLSTKPVPEEAAPSVSTVGESFLALHITAEELASLSSTEIKAKIIGSGCNKAVFEFKSEYGYVYFDVNSFIGGSADKKIADAWDKINELKAEGISCAAYISCFKDTVAASSLKGMEIKDNDGNAFLDNNGFSWLNPFSDKSMNYIHETIRKALDGGFDKVILDNICFPSEYSSVTPVIGDNADDTSKNMMLRRFIDYTIEEFGNNSVIIMSTVSGFSQTGDAPGEKYGGTLMKTYSISHAVDLRINHQDTEIINDSQLFGYINEMPDVFILDAGDEAVKKLRENKEATNIYAVVDLTHENAQELLSSVNIQNIIFW